MLKNTDHQDFGFVKKSVFSTIAVVHVEINNRDALQTIVRNRMARCDGDIV